MAKVYTFDEDVGSVMESVKKDIAKYSKTMSIENAIKEVWDDLDWKIASSDKAHVNQRLKVMSTAMQKLGYSQYIPSNVRVVN